MMPPIEPTLTLFAPGLSTERAIPLSDSPVMGGFPSPAEGYMQDSIDLNRMMVPHPATTFFARVEGMSMQGRGIETGDLVVIDKSLVPQDGDIVVAFLDGEFTMKTLRMEGYGTARRVWLEPANEAFPIIPVDEDQQFLVWGVVTHSVKRHR